ncbi:MAG: nuclear transport factor 2 family protein [Hylemonella sp.]
MSHAVERIVVFFETLTPQDLQRFEHYYTPDATFKDPFHAVQGVAAIAAIFARMFEDLLEPRFVVTGRIQQGEQVVLTWDFHFRFRRFRPAQAQCIRGASLLLLAPDGRIRQHRDYWDAAEELYEKLPLVGALMRWLRRRAGG